MTVSKRESKIMGDICAYCDWASTCNSPCRDAKKEFKKKRRAQLDDELRHIRKDAIGNGGLDE